MSAEENNPVSDLMAQLGIDENPVDENTESQDEVVEENNPTEDFVQDSEPDGEETSETEQTEENDETQKDTKPN